MATTTMEDHWSDVREATHSAILIAFDGCHKIYLAMDETEAKWFRDNYNGENCDDRTFAGSAEEMYEQLIKWYDESCPLKFINAVTHNEENPNAGYDPIIPQGAEDDSREDEDEDED